MSINVLSLFDGISCARLALEQNQTPINNYFASEIDKFPIKVVTHHFPDTIQLGDVKNIDTSTLPKIDLLIGGSPCQDLTSMNREGKGLAGDKSSLFFEFVRIKNELNPKYFLLENVASMKNVDRDEISIQLGVRHIKIDSQHFCAQRRNRYYWTNIPQTELPDPNTDCLQDILESKVSDKYNITEKMKRYVMDDRYIRKPTTDPHIAFPIVASCHKGNRAGIDNYITTTHKPEGKTNLRRLTPQECERLQTLPDNYTDILSDTQRYKAIGNGFTVDVIAHLLKGIG